MYSSLADAKWQDIEALHALLASPENASSVELKSRELTAAFTTRFSSVVLARVFAVVPAGRLDATAKAFLNSRYGKEPRLRPSTPVLTLLATSGREEAWNHRERSSGHLAIPLLDASFVSGIPMVTRLLTDLHTDLANLELGLSIASRRLLGGQNGTFYVSDAKAVRDANGQAVISASPFVTEYGVKTVFGMGGAYIDGTLVTAIFFTDEHLKRDVVDRYPSLIGSFKISTIPAVRQGSIFMNEEGR